MNFDEYFHKKVPKPSWLANQATLLAERQRLLVRLEDLDAEIARIKRYEDFLPICLDLYQAGRAAERAKGDSGNDTE